MWQSHDQINDGMPADELQAEPSTSMNRKEPFVLNGGTPALAGNKGANMPSLALLGSRDTVEGSNDPSATRALPDDVQLYAHPKNVLRAEKVAAGMARVTANPSTGFEEAVTQVAGRGVIGHLGGATPEFVPRTRKLLVVRLLEFLM